MGREIASDLPIEARLREEGFTKNWAGNIDNWKWREIGIGTGTVEAYRVLSKHEAEAMRRERFGIGTARPEPNFVALRAFLDGPCPICNGIHGCSHTVSERLDASRAALRFRPTGDTHGS